MAVHTAVTDFPMRFCCVGSSSSTIVESAVRLAMRVIVDDTTLCSAALASALQRNVAPSSVMVSVPPLSTPDAVRVTAVAFVRLSKMIDGRDAPTVAPLAPIMHSSILAVALGAPPGSGGQNTTWICEAEL